jgi:hypothetical protein
VSVRSIQQRHIECKLTNRRVTIASEQVTVYGEQSLPAASAVGKETCLDKTSACPRDCIFMSGGSGFGRDPETGQLIMA